MVLMSACWQQQLQAVALFARCYAMQSTCSSSLWNTAEANGSCKLQTRTEARAAYKPPPAGTTRQVCRLQLLAADSQHNNRSSSTVHQA